MRVIIASFASLATACFGVVAGIQTGIAVLVSGVVKQLGEGLGVEAQAGASVLALLWISFLFRLAVTAAWFLQWHGNRYVLRKLVEPSKPSVQVTSEY
jgi:hypothetical protein